MSVKKNKAMISCLMVSSPKGLRFPWFEKSIRSFLAQNYRNKELIIVLNGLSVVERRAALRLIDNFDDKRIRVEFIPGNPPLGVLRNHSIGMASGEILCQWDDDDYSHPDRLAKQSKGLDRHSAIVYLQNAYQYFAREGILFWVDWGHYKPNSGLPAGIPGTIMFTSDIPVKYKNSGMGSNLQEDTFLYSRLAKKFPRRISYLRSKFPLYVYTYHGRNSWSFSHHWRSAIVNSIGHTELASCAAGLPAQLLKLNISVPSVDLMCSTGFYGKISLS